MTSLSLAGVFACLLAALQVATYVYNLFFHPLRQFPGPFACRISVLPSALHSLTGNGITWIVDMHRIYGDVVRIAPNELSFSGPHALRDIYGDASRRRYPLDKDPDFYANGPEMQHIGNCDATSHARLRRKFAPAFSPRAAKLHESICLEHVDGLVARVRDELASSPSRVHNMVTLYTCAVAVSLSTVRRTRANAE